MATASVANGRQAGSAVGKDDEDDDNISLTSTVDETSAYDVEYQVKDILAESGNGAYLIEWTGYPLEHCTWEREDQIGSEIVDEYWRKPRQLPDYKPFDMRLYYEAVRRWNARHGRRNAKRKRIGLPMTKLDNPVLSEEYLNAVLAGGGAEAEREEADAGPTAKTAAATVVTPVGKDNGDNVAEAPEPKKRTKTKEDDAAAAGPASETATPAIKTAAAPATKPKPASGSGGGAKETATAVSHARSADKARKTAGPSAATKTTAASPPAVRMAGASSGTVAVPLAKARTGIAKTVTSSTTISPSPSAAVAASARRPCFSARKSSGTAQAAVLGNAFIDGKRTRRTVTLESAVADPSRNSILFNRRLRRIAELRERSRPDGTIEAGALSAKLFPITQGPVLPKQQQQQQEQQQQQQKQPTTTATRGSESGDKPENGGQAKKRRRVRFIISDDDSDSDGNNNGGAATPGGEEAAHSPAQPVGAASQPMHSASTQSARSALVLGPRKEPMPVTISGVVLAAAAAAAASAGPPPLLSAVLGSDPLHFEHICLAESVLVRFQQIQQGTVFHASVAGEAEAAAALERAAQRLRTMASGLFLARPGMGVLLYPTRCDDWKEEMFRLPPVAAAATASLADTPLRCVAFRMPIDFGPFLRKPHQPELLVNNVPDVPDVPQGISGREYLMQEFFQLDRASYLPLFPAPAQPPHAGAWRSVFLAFPPSLLGSMYQMASWVRMIDPLCKIYLCSQPGAWLAFHEALAAKGEKTDEKAGEKTKKGETQGTEAGVVIIHELVTWSVRRFPKIRHLAEGENCHIWSLSQSMTLPGLFPSCGMGLDEPGELDDALSELDENEDEGGQERMRLPGQVRWTRLFPHGMAILVTPSFLVAEPQQAHELFEWFFQLRRLIFGASSASVSASSFSSSFRLVAAWDLCKYLEVLAREKARQRRLLLADSKVGRLRDREERALQLGLGREACKCRFQTWQLVMEETRQYELQEQRWGCRTAGSEREREDGLIAQVPAAVDGNDEQSLVNYFGEWATSRLDAFQAFYVVGTDNKSGAAGAAAAAAAATKKGGQTADIRAKRMIRIPTFVADTTADPDVAWDTETGEVAPEMAAAVAGGREDGQQKASQAHGQSQRGLSATVVALTTHLMRCNTPSDFWRCYGFPVLWKDSTEAATSPLRNQSSTIADWFGFAWSFSVTKHDFRSYVGLFLTVDDEDGEEGEDVVGGRDNKDGRNGEKADAGQHRPALDREMGRHPWLAIYRPVQAHRRPFRNTEVLIWDVRATARLRGMAEPREEDLTPAQQRLVEYVRQHGPEKNPGMDLVSVWIGSQLFEREEKGGGREGKGGKEGEVGEDASSAAGKATNELDMTMQYLDSLVASFRDVLPPTDRHLLNRGYQRVRMRGHGGRDGDGGDGGDEQMADEREAVVGDDEMDEGEEEEDKVRVVVHPPRGTRQQQQQQQQQRWKQQQQQRTIRSRCRNALFDSAQKARRDRPQARRMSFVFRPTTEWYGEQAEEGRGFEHVHVVGWEAFFRAFGIRRAGGASR